ncbi:mucin-1-like [Procambarus clarkii]|uniref:mucin-1-like n=1 Tax=Procambarus clarkii TaxID=6728 RepID=UPI003744990A
MARRRFHSVGERHRGYSIYTGITTSGGSGHPQPQDTEADEPDLGGRNTAAEEAGDAGTVGGGCRGGNTAFNKAGDTEEMAGDVWGGITAADETGDGGGGTEPSERAVFFNTTTRSPRPLSTSQGGTTPHGEPEPSDACDAPEARSTGPTRAPTTTAGATQEPTLSTGPTPAPDAPSSHSTEEQLSEETSTLAASSHSSAHERGGEGPVSICERLGTGR